MTLPLSTPDRVYLAELERAIERTWEIARRFGLDPYPVNFELVPAAIMYEFGAYGLPGRFSHWSRGKAYYRMKTEYDYGLSKIYELVVNTNPSYAFLMEQNGLLQNKLVAAHVLGHTDMFKHNAYFHHTPPNMIDKVSVSADRIRQYEYDHGAAEVERFLDAVLAIEEHIDPNFRIKQATAGDDQHDEGPTPRTTDYDDLFALDAPAIAPTAAEEMKHHRARARRFPPEPVKDILLFLAEHAPHLEDWQRDILLIVREEMRYFVPQMQTKILNEGWACLTADSLVLTDHGMVHYDALHALLARGQPLAVATGGPAPEAITDRHLRRGAPTIRLRTRRGLVLEGARNHKLAVGAGAWLALKDVRVGQRIPLQVGANVWAREMVALREPAQLCHAGARSAPVAAASTLAASPSRGGTARHQAEDAPPAVQLTAAALGHTGTAAPSAYLALITPAYVDEEFAAFLGFIFAAGTIPAATQAIRFTTSDRALVDRYARLVTTLFAIEPVIARHDRAANGVGGRWHAVFYSANVLDLLRSVGIDLRAGACGTRLPDVILRSPHRVVSAFLRAYCDAYGRVSATAGVIIATRSEPLARELQLVLLNYGILSRQHRGNIHISGAAAAEFARVIGFGLPRARERLRAYVCTRGALVADDPTDEVIAVESGTADVYDITVAHAHRYVASGMLHHNSFWHARIMRELELTDSEYTAFAQMHASVLAPQRMSINPYHLGYHILEDIERRWDHPSAEQRAKLGMEPGQGRAQIFAVRETESDVSLLRNYLTKDLVDELDLYLYRKEGDQWVIVDKDWEHVRDGLVANMTNFGCPYMTVDDADFDHNTELLLRHHFEGQELDLPYAEKTLEYIHTIWSRPVHVETVFEGKPIRLSYDGERHSRTVVEHNEHKRHT